ncbi:MAG TPA: hypothetical protein VKI19_02095, partial [Acidimicrobiales bacterium]|nr:hypothetical protein [Acidimicrobiales bacterium]
LGSIASAATSPRTTEGTTPAARAVIAAVGVPPRWLRAPGAEARALGGVSGGDYGDTRLNDIWRSPGTLALASTILILAALLVTVPIALRRRHGPLAAAAAIGVVLPIALGAVSFGLAGGLFAAVWGYAFFAVFAVSNTEGHVAWDGWVSRAVAMLLLGGLLGRASDQSFGAAQRALQNQLERLEAEEQNRRFGEGLELSDSILQYVAVAKWQIEQGDDMEAIRLLSKALDRGEHMIGELLPTLPVGRQL